MNWRALPLIAGFSSVLMLLAVLFVAGAFVLVTRATARNPGSSPKGTTMLSFLLSMGYTWPYTAFLLVFFAGGMWVLSCFFWLQSAPQAELRVVADGVIAASHPAFKVLMAVAVAVVLLPVIAGVGARYKARNARVRGTAVSQERADV